MWPFRKKKSQADLAVEWMPKAIDAAAEKWLIFQNLPLKNDVTLQDKIYMFSLPLAKGLKQWEAFRNSPEELFLLIAAKGVEKSGTHSNNEIAAALGMPYLPS